MVFARYSTFLENGKVVSSKLTGTNHIQVIRNALILSNTGSLNATIISPLSGLDHGEEIAEIIFHAGKVHLVQTQEHRLFWLGKCRLKALTNQPGDKITVQIVVTEEVTAL